MKTNKFKYMALSGAALLLTAFAATSCDDANDWSTDSSHNRLFQVTKMGISANATDAEFTWTTTPGTEYYIIEVSKDTLYNEVAMGSGNGSIVYGEDQTITESPFTLTGLDSDSKYFLRVKSMSSTTPESKWSYPTEFSFKTKSEQIIEKIVKTDKDVIVNWTAGATVTHILLLQGETELKSITLTDEEKTEGSATIDGLEQLTTYTVELYNNTVKRGSVTFQTSASVPEADYTAFLEPTDSLNQTLFNDMKAAGYSNVNIALSAGASYNNDNALNLPDDMSITFFGLPGESKAIIAVKSLNMGSKHGFIKFQNVEVSAYCESTQNQYIFNQSDATEVGSLEFNDCIIRDFKNTPIRLQGSDVKTIGKLYINNTIIYGVESAGYAIVHVDAGSGKGVIQEIEIENSTVKGCGKNFIYCNKTDFTKLTLTNCTFSRMMGKSGTYFFDNGNTTNGPSEGIEITNCIFGSTADPKDKGIRSKATPVIENCYATADWVVAGNAIKDLISYEGTEADLFTDPTNGDFTIKDSMFGGKKSCGDPRWYAE